MSIIDFEQLMRRWRTQLGSRRRWKKVEGVDQRRPFAAMGWLTYGQQPSDLIEIDKVLLVIVHEEDIGNRYAMRMVGYEATRVEHGVMWGGAENCRLYKDLTLQPMRVGSGLRLDTANLELFQMGMQLQSMLHRVCNYTPRAAHRLPQFPRLWAGYRSDAAAELKGEGPELAALSERFDLTPDMMFRKFQRSHEGLALFPLDWVSGQLASAVAVFAEMNSLPRRHVFRARALPDALLGYKGATAWDFYYSPQRQRHEDSLIAKQQARSAVA